MISIYRQWNQKTHYIGIL